VRERLVLFFEAARRTRRDLRRRADFEGSPDADETADIIETNRTRHLTQTASSSYGL
jgi:hypothetical protein